MSQDETWKEVLSDIRDTKPSHGAVQALLYDVQQQGQLDEAEEDYIKASREYLKDQHMEDDFSGYDQRNLQALVDLETEHSNELNPTTNFLKKTYLDSNGDMLMDEPDFFK